ncbi:MAG: TRAP transporter fused permease subunit [Deltaproteobacteria bacterium]|nr:TRAP transporter fused permease subunit [Deltaproteobacteria bacterium]
MKASFTRNLVRGLAICWSLIQLYGSITARLDMLEQMVVHLTFALMLTFLQKPWRGKGRSGGPADYALFLVSLGIGIYFFASYARIMERIRFVDEVSPADLVLGSLLLLLTLEAGRRYMGLGLSGLGAAAILYVFLGFLIPGTFSYSSPGLEAFIDFTILSQEGLFGIPLRVSATMVFLFVLFGSFLQYGKLADFYNDLAAAIAGRLRGGPAKVAVVGSGLMGTISGSAVANVTTTGTITIPMMKGAGYPPATAGAVEALASTGGQVMPPIMGAAAFIMAEILGISYWRVALVAIVPAILYYVSVYASVHFEAVKHGISAVGETKGVTFLGTLARKGYMFIPVIVLIYLLSSGYTVTYSCVISTMISVVCSIIPILARRRYRELRFILDALEDGARSSVIVALPCAVAGVIVGVLVLSSVGLKFTGLILGLAGQSVAPVLVLTALICLVLGMGMPTSGAYITVAILAIPVLVKAGLPDISAHFFGFYFANLSMITPPVALAAYAAAGIAKDNAARVGWRACTMGAGAYLTPFLFITYPSLMLMGGWPALMYDLARCAAVIVAISSAVSGFLEIRLKSWERLCLSLSVAVLWASLGAVWLNAAGWILFILPVVANLVRAFSSKGAPAAAAVIRNANSMQKEA